MIKADEYNDVCVLTITGDLAGADCQETRQVVEKQIETRQIVNFALDLEQCNFIDSEGLELLLWIKSRSDDLFGMMKVVNPNENCRKILEITRLEKRLDVENDLSFALKSMR